jgi:uncharacterized LabA/DUF88 family protein
MSRKTIIYIDGYNLYYSRLKNTPFKWLDVVALFRDQLLRAQDPTAEVIAVKYFTAPVKASYARHGTLSEQAQTQYLRALKAKYAYLEVINGFHIFEPTKLPTFIKGVPASKDNLSSIWMIEEKQTDENLSLQVYRDAIKGNCDQIVICSNDSDVEPVLKLLALDTPEVIVGLVLPLPPPCPDNSRVSNKRLMGKTQWVRHYIRDEELAKAQLPQQVPTAKKPAVKPLHW